jgi:ribonucleoside-diphosphate reductase alpha chain
MAIPTTFEEWLGKDNTLGKDIVERKYRRRNESFDEFLDRVSGGDRELRQLILEKKFLLGGRTLANRGMGNSATYFNCYSIGYVPDDFAEIMEYAKKIGLTFKAQGGQGLSLSKLRPKGTPIGKDYASDGIVPFMKLYNEVTAATSQCGARKGALLMSLDARHKEALDFIRIKSQEGVVEKANLSLEIDDEFMKAAVDELENGQIVLLREKQDYSGHEVQYDVHPTEILHELAQNSWDWGDPAVLYTNRLRNYNLMQYDDEYQIETTNPLAI